MLYLVSNSVCKEYNDVIGPNIYLLFGAASEHPVYFRVYKHILKGSYSTRKNMLLPKVSLHILLGVSVFDDGVDLVCQMT